MTADHSPEWLRRRAETHGPKRALVTEGETWSFAALSTDADRAAHHLSAAGIRAGMRVGILSANSGSFAVVLHALTRLGAIAVPLNLRLTPHELTMQLSDVNAEVVLVDQRGESLLAHSLESLEGVRLLPIEAWRDGRGDPLPRPSPSELLALEAPQMILFTSGTTGRPKGAVITYGNTWWNALGSALNLGLHADDAWLLCLPLFHIGGLSILMRSVIYGIPAIVHERFNARRVNETIESGAVSIVSVVSRMLEEMLDARGDRPFPATLRCVLIGGGPVPAPLLERSLKAQVPIVQTYGMTETASQMATLSPQDAVRKAGSAGKALMGAEVRVDASGDEVGEILVRGPVVSPGYWGAQYGDHLDAEGWFHTQDLGYVDSEGYLYVVSRRNDLIISGGENVYPAEVERVLTSHPAVREAAVVGRPDAAWGEVPVAYVVLCQETGSTNLELSEALSVHCRNRLAKYKVPVAIYSIERLPRNAGGKILRAHLRELARARSQSN